MLKKLISSYHKNNGSQKIAINAGIIYIQRVIAALLALITTPLLLKVLGAEDYGIYSLTIGLIGMLAFINWSLSSATQRFIAFSIGEKNKEKQRNIFYTSFIIHLAYGLVLLICIAIFSKLIVRRWLSIPEERYIASQIVLYLVAIISFSGIIKVPFLGILRAHEDFLFISAIGIIESVLKLFIVVSLFYISFDKLIIYGLFVSVLSVILFIIYLKYCLSHFSSVNFNGKNFDKGLLKEIFGFISWSLFGALAILGRNQAVAVILNLFFGVISNAAYGIARQVNFAVGMLGQGIVGAVSPKIIKSAGAGNLDESIYLMRTMSKFGAFSIALPGIVFLFKAPTILGLWLGKVPEHAVIFSQLIVVMAFATALSAGISNVFNAIGKVKLYNIYVSLIIILNVPIGYWLFTLGFPSYSILIIAIVLELVSLGVRLVLLKKYLNFSILIFLNDMIIKLGFPIYIICIMIIIVLNLQLNNHVELILIFLFQLLLYPILVYRLTLDKRQKELAIQILKKIPVINKIKFS